MNAGNGSAARLRTLCLWAAFLPFATFNACYVIAASLEHVPQCIPYLDGCTSASSTGRQSPERWLFKLFMLPLVPVVFLLWTQAARFLPQHAPAGNGAALLRWSGSIAAAALLLYVIVLGLPGDEMRSVRRIGINGFALALLASQIVFMVRYRPIRTARTRHLLAWMIGICALLPALSIAAEWAKAAGAPRHATNNIVAWNALWLQSLWFLLLARLVRCFPGKV